MQNDVSASNTQEFVGLGHSDEVEDDSYLLRKGLVTLVWPSEGPGISSVASLALVMRGGRWGWGCR